MSNPKVFEFAKEIGMTPLALMDKIREWHLPVKSHMAELEPDVLDQLKIKLRGGPGQGDGKPKKAPVKRAPVKKTLEGSPSSTVGKGLAAKGAGGKATPGKTIAKGPAKSAAKTAAADGPVSSALVGKSTVVRRKAKEVEEAATLESENEAGEGFVSDEEVDLAASSADSELQTSHAEEIESEVQSEVGNVDELESEVATSKELKGEGIDASEVSQKISTGAAQKTGFIPLPPKKVVATRPVTPAVKPASSVQIQRPITSATAGAIKAGSVPPKTTPAAQSSQGGQGAGQGTVPPTSGQGAKIEDSAPGGAVVPGLGTAAVGSSTAPGSHHLAARKKEVVVGTSGVASAATPMVIGRKNIVGRMDLSRVQNMQGGPSTRPTPSGGPGLAGTRPGGFSAPSRPGAQRNLRAGFVAQPTYTEVPEFEDEASKNKKNLEKRSKKLEITTTATPKERELEEIKDFNAVEFRKREMVFQPKKKKGVLSRESKRTQITQPKASKRILKIFGVMKVSDLAQEMGLKAAQLIKVLIANGVMANMNTVLDFDTIALISPEFGWETQNIQKTAEEVVDETAFGNLAAEKVSRPPVVTIMGHVDHGKTSLLDAIRSAKVAAGEAGGITQHIGAYSVTLDTGHVITFLDTPGHEAFTAMRARGANATDIAVIVVAADDGMMPQTQEAISHAKAAGVPIIVAINKMDKPGANPDKIKQQLTEMELVPEEWGGTTIYCPVSALKGTGIPELLNQIHLVAEMQEIKANPQRSGTGLVIEARLEKGRGPVATLLVKDGTVRIGQSLVAGLVKGRVRSMTNDRGESVKEVGPGYPVEVLGLESTPAAGDRFDIVIDDATAERAAQIRKEKADLAKKVSGKMSVEEIFSKATQGDVKELSLILKADVHGSLEAIQGMIGKLSNPEVKLRVIHSGVGGINESDVLLAQTAKGLVIGFNVRPDTGAQAKGKQLNVDVRTYTIVYELIDDLKKVMGGMLTPDIIEKVMGRAEVRNTFTVPKLGTIAGCLIVDGKIQRSNQVRLVRDGKIVYEGKIGSLKRFKDDTKEVAQGFECGLGIENYYYL